MKNALFRFLKHPLIALGGLVLLVVSQPAFADPINVTGDPKDVQAFKDMIKACREKSKSFDKLIGDIEKDKTRGGKINISVGRMGAYVDNATGGMGHTDVNLSNLETFPDPPAVDPKNSKDTLKMPAGVPPWATTRCEIMAHFIAEAHSTASTASKDIGGGHRTGITIQNQVRADFRQRPAATGSYNYYSEGKPTDGEGDASSGKFLYTKISYGEANVRLTFTKGMLDFDYYTAGGTKYVSPPPPKTPPPKTNAKTNGDISYGAGNTCANARTQTDAIALGCIDDPNQPRSTAKIAPPAPKQQNPIARTTPRRDQPGIYENYDEREEPRGSNDIPLVPGSAIPGGGRY